MAYPYAGDPNNYPAEIHPPDDGDNRREAATWQVPYEELADRTAYLGEVVPVAVEVVDAIARVASGALDVSISSTALPGGRMLLCFIGCATNVVNGPPPELVYDNNPDDAADGVPMIGVGGFTAGSQSPVGCYYLPDCMLGVGNRGGVGSNTFAYRVKRAAASPDVEHLMLLIMLTGVHPMKAPNARYNSLLAAPSMDAVAGGMLIDIIWNDDHTEDPTCDASQTELADGNGGGTDIRVSVSSRAFAAAGSAAMTWTGATAVKHLVLSLDPTLRIFT